MTTVPLSRERFCRAARAGSIARTDWEGLTLASSASPRSGSSSPGCPSSFRQSRLGVTAVIPRNRRRASSGYPRQRRATVRCEIPITVTYAGDGGRPARRRAVHLRRLTGQGPGRFEWLSDNIVQCGPRTSSGRPTRRSRLRSAPCHLDFQRRLVGRPGRQHLSAHTFTVSIDGEVAQRMPASMGNPNIRHRSARSPSWKQNPVVMDSRTIGIPLNDPETTSSRCTTRSGSPGAVSTCTLVDGTQGTPTSATAASTSPGQRAVVLPTTSASAIGDHQQLSARARSADRRSPLCSPLVPAAVPRSA